MNKGVALKNLNKYTESLDCYEIAIRLDSANPLGYYNKALSLHKLNKFEEAFKFYSKAIELNENDADFYFNRFAINFFRSLLCYFYVLFLEECVYNKCNDMKNLLKILINPLF